MLNRSYTDKVDRWHNSSQILRWTGMGLMDNEPQMHRVKGHNYLKALRHKLREVVKARKNGKASVDLCELLAVN